MKYLPEARPEFISGSQMFSKDAETSLPAGKAGSAFILIIGQADQICLTRVF